MRIYMKLGVLALIGYVLLTLTRGDENIYLCIFKLGWGSILSIYKIIILLVYAQFTMELNPIYSPLFQKNCFCFINSLVINLIFFTTKFKIH